MSTPLTLQQMTSRWETVSPHIPVNNLHMLLQPLPCLDHLVHLPRMKKVVGLNGRQSTPENPLPDLRWHSRCRFPLSMSRNFGDPGADSSNILSSTSIHSQLSQTAVIPHVRICALPAQSLGIDSVQQEFHDLSSITPPRHLLGSIR